MNVEIKKIPDLHGRCYYCGGAPISIEDEDNAEVIIECDNVLLNYFCSCEKCGRGWLYVKRCQLVEAYHEIEIDEEDEEDT